MRFIENDAEILFAHALRGGRMLEEFVRKRDLISVSDDAAFEPEIAIIALDFRGHAARGIGDPSPQRCERFPPARRKFLRVRRTNRPSQKIPVGIVPLLPIREFGF